MPAGFQHDRELATNVACGPGNVLGPAGVVLTVRMFGEFEVLLHGQPVDRWRAGRTRGLFQYLLMHRDQLVTRERLQDVLWPDSGIGPCASSLKVACHGLRKVLGAGGSDHGLCLQYRGSGYVLHADDARVDVAEFERLISSGLRAADLSLSDRARCDLSAAMSLYVGDFLDGAGEDWVVEQREYLKGLAMQAMQELRGLAERAGRHHELIALCHRTLDLDCHHEPTFRTLIALFGRLGETERARSWYQLCATRLRDNLGVAPAPSTVAAIRLALGASARPAVRAVAS